MIRLAVVAALVAGVGAVLMGCPAPSRPIERSFLITWGESGIVEPATGFAGLTREITVLRDEEKKQKPDATIAAGNFMPSDAVMPKQFAKLFLAAAHEFDVCGVGPYELNNGPPILDLIARAPCLVGTQLKGTQVPPMKILPLSQGGALAVVTYIPNSKPEVAGIPLDPARPEATLAEARQKASLILVLAYDLYRSQAIDLLTRHPEVDIIFGRIRPDPGPDGKTPRPKLTGGSVESFGKSWVVDAGQVGMYRLTAEVRGGIVESLEARPIPVTCTVAEPADLAPLKDAYLADRKALRIGEPMAYAGYSGVLSCKVCHQQEFEHWSVSPHAGAMLTLTETRDEYTPECLACHSTGFSEPGGFRNFATTPTFGAVQCEACHGPALAHMQDAHKRRPLPPAVHAKRPTRETCLKCHTPKWSPKFDYGAALKTIDY